MSVSWLMLVGFFSYKKIERETERLATPR